MGGIRLGSVLGFEIRVDLSWFIIFFLVLWTLAFGLFPANYPQLGFGTHLLMGAAATVLFFASLLAHELSHSLLARAKGIPVEGITLFLFGGVARMRSEAENPGDEFQIAAVGPIVSLALAGLFGLLVAIGVPLGWSIAVLGVFQYLAVINLALALFNLLPGFPLDGGRLFRAIVWQVTGDLEKATRIATTGGRWLGYLIIALGVLQLFGANFLGGLWFILIGWFLASAADSSYQDLLMRRSLAGVRAREVMTPNPETVRADLSLQDFIDEYVFHGRHQAYPVLEDGQPVGIVSLQQIRNAPREDWARRTVRETMTPIEPGLAARPEENMSVVLRKMEESGSRRILVISGGQLLGIIAASDLAGWLQRRREFGPPRAVAEREPLSSGR